MDGPSHRHRALWIAALSALAAAVTWRALLHPLEGRPLGDWRYFVHMWEVGRLGLARAHTLADWDPFHCGGVSVWNNPQSQLLHPLFPLALALGSVAALKLFFITHAAAGYAGMYLLARSRGVGPAGAVAASAVWAGSGFFAWHGNAGHSTFAAFYLAPWALLAWRRAEVDLRGGVAVAGVFTAALLAGGTYPVPFLALLLALDALPRMHTWDGFRGVIRAGAVALPLTMALGAARVAPIIVSLHRHPRVMHERDAPTLAMLRDMLIARRHPYAVPGHLYAWDEYGAYIGAGALALALLGALISLRRRHFALPVGALLLGLLTLGDAAPFFPWPLLRHLPIFASLRVPSRFAVLLTLYLALLAAAAIDAFARALQARWPSRLTTAAPWLLAAALAVDVTAASSRVIDAWPTESSHLPVAQRFSLTSEEGYLERMAGLPARNLGSLGCYEPLPTAVAPDLWTGDVLQARASAGEVRAAAVDTDALWAEVSLPRPARVVFNQNYDPDWFADRGRVVSDHGRLAVDLPAGHHRVHAWYAPPTARPAALLSALGLVVAVMVYRAQPRRGRAPRSP